MTKEEKAAYRRNWRKANPDKERASRKRWAAKNPDKIRESTNHQREKNQNKYTEKQRTWRRAHPLLMAAYTSKWSSEHQFEVRRSRLLMKAVHDGIIIRPTKCEFCETDCKPVGHHYDPVNPDPLLVNWLCIKCHRKLSAKLRSQKFQGQCQKCRFFCKVLDAPTLKFECFKFLPIDRSREHITAFRLQKRATEISKEISMGHSVALTREGGGTRPENQDGD